jgi:Fic family protein
VPHTQHPFISFSFDTSGLKADVWMLFGEGFSKCQHLAGAPLNPEAASTLSSVFLARGVAATTAIEGNTLSEAEVQQIVEKGSADVSESRAYLEREVQNVLSAVRELDDALQAGERPKIDVARLCYLNAKVLDGIPDKPEVTPGQLREHDVVAGTYKAPHWTAVPELLEQFVRWLSELRDGVTSASRPEDRFVNAFLSAILAHLYIAWVHPFGNGNGRLARLIEVQILSESGIVPLVATNLLSDHYNKTRDAYYLALNAAQQDVGAFVRYAARGFVDELREQIALVRRENVAIHWESYVHGVFKEQPRTQTRDRQRDVALTVEANRTISPENLPDLSTSLARQYATAGPRIPARDLNDLVRMGLFKKVGHRKFQARRDIIEAFIPPTFG